VNLGREARQIRLVLGVQRRPGRLEPVVKVGGEDPRRRPQALDETAGVVVHPLAAARRDDGDVGMEPGQLVLDEVRCVEDEDLPTSDPNELGEGVVVASAGEPGEGVQAGDDPHRVALELEVLASVNADEAIDGEALVPELPHQPEPTQ